MHSQPHDMDDLFRRAAARYPLNTTNSDWDAVAQKLNSAAGPAINKRYYRGGKYYAWLLLLPAAFMFHNAFRNIPAGNNTEKSSLPVIIENKTEKPSTAPVIEIRSNKIMTREIKVISESKSFAASLPVRADDNPGISTGKISAPVADIRTAPTRKQTSKTKGFYLGATAGIDFGNVRGQSFTDAGYNIGLLAGYRFNKHWSFEAGITWITKKYFTRGEHFSMQKIQDNMPAGMQMMAVKGQLSLIEIPYKLKYDLLLRKRSNFFIAAGGSTNIYIKEKNEYHTRRNGIPEMQKASYRNLHCSPLCLVHVSAGYEYLFRNNNRLRLEPYVKFPLRKVGMGSVSLLSVGLNVSVSGFLGGRNR